MPRACSILSILLSLALRVLHAGAGYRYTSTAIWGCAEQPRLYQFICGPGCVSSRPTHNMYITAPLYENQTSALDWRCITSTLRPTLLYSLQQLLIPSRKNDLLAWTISTPLVFGSVPAKVKALCCFGPILGDGRLNGVWAGPINRSSYVKSCHRQAFSRLCGLRHCQQYHPHGPIVWRGRAGTRSPNRD